MSRHTRARFPFDALEQLYDGPPGTLATVLRVHRRSLPRMRRDGLGVWKADELATRIGRHPASVWGADWIHAANAAAQEFEERVAYFTARGPLARWQRAPLGEHLVAAIDREQALGRAEATPGRGSSRLTVSVRQVAAALGISESATYARVRNGEIPSIPHLNGHVLIPRRWLDLQV